MSEPDVRPMTVHDVPAVLDMIRDLAAHHGDTPTVTQETLRRDALGEAPWYKVLVADREGMLRGYAVLIPLAQVQFGVRGMDMHHLFVRRQSRGAGVGRRLIDGSKDWCRRAGCRYLAVGTHPDNAAAAQVYRAAGFDPLPAPGPRFRIRLS